MICSRLPSSLGGWVAVGVSCRACVVAAGVLVVVVPLAILIMRGGEIGDLVDEAARQRLKGYLDGFVAFARA